MSLHHTVKYTAEHPDRLLLTEEAASCLDKGIAAARSPADTTWLGSLSKHDELACDCTLQGDSWPTIASGTCSCWRQPDTGDSG